MNDRRTINGLRLYMHTTKAVKANSAITIAPEDRVFLVVGQEGKRLIAWKCTLTQDGLDHPGFPFTALPLTEHGLNQGAFDGIARNGAEPTAVFKPDSFYREVTLEELKRLASVSTKRFKPMNPKDVFYDSRV